MTAGASRLRRSRQAQVGAVAVVLAVALTGCNLGDQRSGTGSAPAAVGVASTIPGDDEAAIRGTIDALNATAGGTVAGQQEALATAVDPALTSALADCPPTTTTLRFEPTYQGLRAAPDWTGSSGSLTGTIYALPTLIRIYTGDRMTGTDLTTLHLGVSQGKASITPLCVG